MTSEAIYCRAAALRALAAMARRCGLLGCLALAAGPAAMGSQIPSLADGLRADLALRARVWLNQSVDGLEPDTHVRQNGDSNSNYVAFSRIELADVLFAPVSLKPTGQEPAADSAAQAATNPFGSGLVTAHGVVRNAATGEPLPRALVRVEGDAASAALTDGEGRFEIPGLTPGPELFEVQKPGFLDHGRADVSGGNFVNDGADSAHNVILTAEMPDLEFALAPSCSIHGRIELSTGDTAQGIEVQLLKRTVDDGRAVWQAAATTRALSDGSYRFAGLTDGEYAVYTNPALESEPATNLVARGRAADVEHEGYASQFYPDARNLAGAAKITLRSGEQAAANLNLTLEPFHSVNATATFPGVKDEAKAAASDDSAYNFEAVLSDAEGHQLPYGAVYDPATRTVQAQLPDGTYSLVLTAMPRSRFIRFGREGFMEAAAVANAVTQTGSVEFTVIGHAIADLRVPLSAVHGGQVQVSVQHSTGANQTTQGQAAQGLGGRPRSGAVLVTLSRTGQSIDDGQTTPLAQGEGPGPIEAHHLAPGTYWAHTRFMEKGLCVTSFTAGGANLAREPLVLGVSGAGAPLELAARDDCASLTLTLPASAGALTAGEERFFTVYVVPEFDSTADVEPLTLRPTSGATASIEGLTPGSYRVYTFAGSFALEYRNPDALAALPNAGQQITLAPGDAAHLVVEAPGR